MCLDVGANATLGIVYLPKEGESDSNEHDDEEQEHGNLEQRAPARPCVEDDISLCFDIEHGGREHQDAEDLILFFWYVESEVIRGGGLRGGWRLLWEMMVFLLKSSRCAPTTKLTQQDCNDSHFFAHRTGTGTGTARYIVTRDSSTSGQSGAYH